MIGSARTGASFHGLSAYLLRGRGDEEHRVAWTAIRNIPTRDPRVATGVMDATAAQNHRVQKPVYHLSLSAAPGERFSQAEWEAIAERVLRRLDLHENQVLLVAHCDTAHQHLHVMINRVHPERLRAWDDGHDYRRIERALRHLECDLGLRRVPGHHYQLDRPADEYQPRPDRSHGLTSGEVRQARREGQEAWAARVRFQAHRHFKEAESWADLERRLARHGLRLRRKGQGLVVTDGRRQVKASRIHRGGSYAKLGRRFGCSFEEWRGQRDELRQAIAQYEDLERRRRHLLRRERNARFDRDGVREALLRRQHLALASRDAAHRLNAELRRIYLPQDVSSARRRLVALAREHGWERAARDLERSPERFGRLLGRNVGPLRSPARRAGRLRAGHAAHHLRQLAALRLARATLGREAAGAAATLARTSRSLQRTVRTLRSLPTRRAMELEIADRALKLGVSAVRLMLAPRPWALVRAAVRTAELAREVSRQLER